MRIYIIGFMGSGKTHWGKIWAASAHMELYDLDSIIEEAEQMSVEQIFEKKGVLYFRQKEAALLRSTVDYDNCIVSCGGGTPCFEGNMAWMLEHGETVYLKAEAPWLLTNMFNELDKRPLFKNIDQKEIITFINGMLHDREEYYQQATIVLDATKLSSQTINQIIHHSENLNA